MAACYICPTMLFMKSYFFSFFWFSHRPGGGEASV